ncbi:MAG: TolC family protein [Pseudomonadota bacterium]|nr:TolC family protein [Pseudomonadota bacterium]
MSRVLSVLAALPLFIATVAIAEPLSFDDALKLAEVRSRALPAKEASAAAARQMAVAAGQRPDPVLTAGVNNLPVTTSDRFSLSRDFMTMRSIGVMQQLTRGSKLDARTARFEREAEAAEAGRALALTELQRETAMAWLDLYYLQRMTDVLLAQRDEARLQIDAADAGYRGGRGSQAEVFAARSAVEQLENRLVDSRQQVATARSQLARWIGSATAEALGPLPAMSEERLHEHALESELAAHPQIELMRRREAVAVAEAEVARSEKSPDVSVQLMYNQREPAFSNMISLNFSVPLQWNQAKLQDREVAAKLAVVEQLRNEREEATRSYMLDASTLLQKKRSTGERMRRYDETLVPLAVERTRASLAAYRGGGGSLASVLQAREAEVETRLDRIRLAMDEARLWTQINFLLPIARPGVQP